MVWIRNKKKGLLKRTYFIPKAIDRRIKKNLLNIEYFLYYIGYDAISYCYCLAIISSKRSCTSI